jgi:Zn-dependent protease with chaperone function
MEWATDRGLQLRIGLALVLVAALPVAFVYAFVFAFNTIGLDLLAWATDRTWNPLHVDLPLVMGGVAAGFVVQFLFGDRIALRSAGASRVDRDARPDLIARIERLARIAELPPPDVAVSDSPVPNAFTVGVRPSEATVVVTEGLLETLEEDELDAVIAHELAHVANRDVAVMSIAYVLPSVTYLVAIAAFTVLKGMFYVLGSANHVDDDGAKGLVVVIVVLGVSAITTLTISALFWLGSFTLFRTLSQYREFAADRGAAAITGEPAALVTALRNVDDGMSEVADRDLREIDGGLEALYVAPIDDYQFGGEDRDLISSDVFPATHPPTEERIERLRDVANGIEE